MGTAVGDGTRPSAFAGHTVRWNQNAGLAFGVVVYPHRRLDSRYVEDQVISENLDAVQLNRDVIRANAFAGITIRFGADPRKTPETPKEEGGEEPAN